MAAPAHPCVKGAMGGQWCQLAPLCHVAPPFHTASPTSAPPVPSTTSCAQGSPTSRHSLAQPTLRHTAPHQGMPRQQSQPLAPPHPHVALSTAPIPPVFFQNTPIDKDTIVGGGQGVAEGAQGHGDHGSTPQNIGQNRPLLRAQGAGGWGARGEGWGRARGPPPPCTPPLSHPRGTMITL